MKRGLVVVAGLLLAASVAAIWYRFPPDGDWALHRRLSTLVERAGDEPFAIAKATDFEWDAMHVFWPYTPNEDVAERLGFAWPDGRHVGMQMRDDAVLLAFVRSHEVVAYVAQPRNRGDFSAVPTKPPYTPETAIFRVRNRDGWQYLEAAHPSMQPEQTALNQRRWPSDAGVGVAAQPHFASKERNDAGPKAGPPDSGVEPVQTVSISETVTVEADRGGGSKPAS